MFRFCWLRIYASASRQITVIPHGSTSPSLGLYSVRHWFGRESALLSRTCQGRFARITYACRVAQARAARSTGLAAVMAVQLRRQQAPPCVELVTGGIARPRQVDEVLVVDPAGTGRHHHDAIGQKDRLL